MMRSTLSSGRSRISDALVSAAQAHGLEIALDFAVQCSLDHPWIKEHPEWFDWRPDGSIRFAENPPKKVRRHRQRALLRGRISRRVDRAPRCGAVLGGAGRQDFPRRQSAHEAVPVLGVAHP